MNFLNVLACPEELDVLIKIIKIFLNGVRYIIPIVLIVIGTVDLAKAVLAKTFGNKSNLCYYNFPCPNDSYGNIQCFI